MEKKTMEKRKPSCSHGYAPMERSYYKTDGNTIAPKADQSIAYIMLFCHKCGDTIEVIAKDHRKKDEPST